MRETDEGSQTNIETLKLIVNIEPFKPQSALKVIVRLDSLGTGYRFVVTSVQDLS